MGGVQGTVMVCTAHGPFVVPDQTIGGKGQGCHEAHDRRDYPLRCQPRPSKAEFVPARYGMSR